QEGVACHTGRKSCFFTKLNTNEIISDVEINTSNAYGIIDTLYHTIQEKKNDDPSKSYTAKLLQGKQNSMLKKIVEESGEFTFAIKDNDEQEIIYEAADITYHVLVALASKNISPDRVKQELARRFGISGIEEKNSRIDK
nr:phosphoribosyl-ATP diphosphatase [Aliarcobacter sp.]